MQAGRHRTRGNDAHPLAGGSGQLIAVTRNTPVEQLEAHQLAGHALGFLALHAGAVDEILALGELGDPAESGLDGRRGVVDIVTVEAETLLQTQRVAGAEADVLQSELLAGLPERLPELLAVLVGHVDFAAARPGVARDRENGVAARHGHLAEGVILHLLDRLGAHLLHDLHGQRPLDGELADFVRSVVQLLAVAGLHAERLALGADVVPVLFDVGSIDHQQVGLGVDAIDQQVVHDTATSVGHAGVLHLAVHEFRHVVGRDALQQGEGLGALDPDLPHVAHVEHARTLAHGQVFVVDARELDGHVVARELGHFGSGGDVILGKYGGFHKVVLGFAFFVHRATRVVSPPGADSGGTPGCGRTGSGRWCASCGAWRRRRFRSCGSSRG